MKVVMSSMNSVAGAINTSFVVVKILSIFMISYFQQLHRYPAFHLIVVVRIYWWFVAQQDFMLTRCYIIVQHVNCLRIEERCILGNMMIQLYVFLSINIAFWSDLSLSLIYLAMNVFKSSGNAFWLLTWIPEGITTISFLFKTEMIFLSKLSSEIKSLSITSSPLSSVLTLLDTPWCPDSFLILFLNPKGFLVTVKSENNLHNPEISLQLSIVLLVLTLMVFSKS